MKPSPRLNRAAVAMLGLLLTACGGDDVDPQQNPPPANRDVSTYSGPAPANSDVQSFRLSLWEGLRGDDRCGNCHSEAGGQEPLFARSDDVNLAYQAALPLVDADSPGLSLITTKVGGGHNCWAASNSACADIIVRFINDWLGGSGGGAGRQIELVAPVVKDVGASLSFPTTPTAFAGDLHLLLQDFCAECHSETAEVPQSPFFAGADATAAYDAVRSRINLDDPPGSRLVVRLREEFHNCWSGDCAADADIMQGKIEAFASGLVPTPVDPALVVSKALRIDEGLVAAGASRHERDAIAIWEFKTGSGNTAFDTSGVDPALDLTLSAGTNWVGGWGIEFKSPSAKAQGSTTSSEKLHRLITATGEFSIEAWVVPANVTQEGPARIVNYAGGLSQRNFMLGQTLYNYDFLSRSSVSDADGAQALSTEDAAEVLQATQQHVVVTYDASNGRRIYVNGEFTGGTDPLGPGVFDNWDSRFALVLGNEVSGNRPWAGRLRMVAIHNRVLTDQQIAENFAAGVGQKFYLLFGISHLTGQSQAYLMFEVSQFDNFSYLFTQPTFVSLDSATPPVVPLRGIRIGINGKEAVIGQSYANIRADLGGNGYVNGRQPLSSLGAVVALEKGPDSDEFFVSFDAIGANQHVRVDNSSLVSLSGPDIAEASRIGLRTFEEIHATMSSLTGVATTQADVSATFQAIHQQLPGVEAMDGFLSAHQIAIAQLAIEYCNALVESPVLRAELFPAFDFAAAAPAIAPATWESQVVNPLIDRMQGSNLAVQPDPLDVRNELNGLIGKLTACGVDCAPDRTATVAKAACSAMLGSAVTLVQ